MGVRFSLVAEEAEREERRKRETGDVGHLQALVFWVSACSFVLSPSPVRDSLFHQRKKSVILLVQQGSRRRDSQVGSWHGDTGVLCRSSWPR